VPELGLVSSQSVNLASLESSFPAWRTLASLVESRFAPDAHGDMPRWLAALAALPQLSTSRTLLGDRVTVEGHISAEQRARLIDALRQLHPWRKGPFSLFDVDIDTEWRSDWKWRRVRPHVDALAGARVLDIGCGNGYFGWRMLEAGARLVLGVDPTLLFCMQHRAINRYVDSDATWVLPMGVEELPEPDILGGFDVVFSMGVVYHRRDPEAHVRGLFQHTRRGGQVVLESLVVKHRGPLRPQGRYARMRNVHIVPDTDLLLAWLSEAGFDDPRIVDVTATGLDEQRTTDWMRFESLQQALDPGNPERTVEGYPRPVRAIAIARKHL